MNFHPRSKADTKPMRLFDILKNSSFLQSQMPVIFVTVIVLAIGVLRSDDLASNLTWWITLGLLALSLQFIWGNVGILSFAQAVFFGIGAYAYGILSINLGVQGSNLFWIVPAGLVAAIVAASLGYFIFFANLSEIAVAIITFAFTLIFAALSSGFAFTLGSAVIGGANGLVGIQPLAFGFGENIVVLDTITAFMMTLLCFAIIWSALTSLRNARYGRILNGIRQNESRSTLIGYDIRAFKLSSFSLAGAVAGVGGALFAAWSQFVNPGQFSVNAATLVVVFVLVGGRRSPIGSVIGAFLISALQFYFGSSGFSQYVTLILGIIVVVVVLVAPDGVSALATNLWQRIRGGLSAKATTNSTQTSTPRDDTTSYERFISAVNGGLDPTAKLLQVDTLSKGFGGVKAVQNVNFALAPKEIKCIIGPNGAGKSTLFGLLSGRLRQDTGIIFLSGTDISRMPSFKRARLGIGIKLQTASFFSELTVRENIDLAARVASAEDRPGLVDSCVAEVGLKEFAETEAFSLSHGQQQWLEIGMVLAQLPKLILLDEPVAGMTLGERSETVRMIHRLSNYCGVIVVEHDMSVVEELGGEVIVMHEGQVLRTGVIQALRKDEAVLEAYLGREAEHAGDALPDGELEGDER